MFSRTVYIPMIPSESTSEARAYIVYGYKDEPKFSWAYFNLSLLNKDPVLFPSLQNC